jgi:hypothetical protein
VSLAGEIAANLPADGSIVILTGLSGTGKVLVGSKSIPLLILIILLPLLVLITGKY